MTLSKMTTGASSTVANQTTLSAWDKLPWKKMEREVKRLQMRIAKAIQEGKYHKAKALQWLLTHSSSAKYLAVKKVTSNRGKKTPGVDGVLWKWSKHKFDAVNDVKRTGYKVQPLKRVYIPKKNGKLRPLGIPTMKDRAMQALHLMALLPVSESKADLHSYGFRPYRSCADAIEMCFCALAKKTSAPWILEGDIKACFDRIDHDWLLNNTMTDQRILKSWLKAGYCESKSWYPTEAGTPQGGIISPTLANGTLDGLEAAIAQAMGTKMARASAKVHVVRYADDFVVTAQNRNTLEQQVKPAIEQFLKQRGLELSPEKTRITHIDDGFDFLGFNIRKYNQKLIIKPSKESVKKFLASIREIIKQHKTDKTVTLIRKLNPIIRGWSNYYRHVVSSQVFSKVDHHIHQALWRWIKRRHPKKNRSWRHERYFCTVGHNRWKFCARLNGDTGAPALLTLVQASSIKIKRHVKLQAIVNPFDPQFSDYLSKRKRKVNYMTTELDDWVELSALSKA
jgi:RNA-directed DNA polymerase